MTTPGQQESIGTGRTGASATAVVRCRVGSFCPGCFGRRGDSLGSHSVGARCFSFPNASPKKQPAPKSH
jgi:hypothetical protein